MKYNIKLQTIGAEMYDSTTGITKAVNKEQLAREAEVLKTISRLNAMTGVNLSAEQAGEMIENAHKLHLMSRK